jgi:hypothetical protein
MEMKMFAKRIRLLPFLAVIALVIIFGMTHSRPVSAGSQALPAQQSNLLNNPGFEGQYSAWNGINEIQMAPGWTPWWIENPGNYPQHFRPEYKQAVGSIYPNRVRSGEYAQQYFTFHASHYAGMYQQVFNVTPGQNYQFTIWVQVWTSTADDPNTSYQPANPHLQIGIDPTGLWDPNGSTVIWSPEAPMFNHIDQWGAVSVEAATQNDVLTVMVRTSPAFPNKHNDMYWDDATLFAVGPPEPTAPPPPPPTNTPGPPTNTPIPSDTPVATNIPAATNTPPPPPPPTNTPVPTDTAEPSPTPEPSNTPRPTTVPTEIVVTVTVADTATAEPTEEPTEEATEIAANPTEENTPEPTAEFPTSESNEEEGDSSDAIVAISIVGFGVVIGLLAAGVITMLRRTR